MQVSCKILALVNAWEDLKLATVTIVNYSSDTNCIFATKLDEIY